MGTLAAVTVFLDWGGTLAFSGDEEGRPWAVWARVLAEQGRPLDEIVIRAAIESADRELGGAIYDYVGRLGEYWLRYDDVVMDRLGVTTRRADTATAVDAIFGAPGRVQLYPDTLRVLRALRHRGHALGLVSNHNDALLEEVRRLGLQPLLGTVTYSQEARAEKPDPGIFQLALRRAGCRASDAVFVGDSLTNDVGGARAVGISPIWLNRAGLNRDAGCPTIRSLDELESLLAASPGAGEPGPVPRDDRGSGHGGI